MPGHTGPKALKAIVIARTGVVAKISNQPSKTTEAHRGPKSRAGW